MAIEVPSVKESVKASEKSSKIDVVHDQNKNQADTSNAHAIFDCMDVCGVFAGVTGCVATLYCKKLLCILAL